MKATQILPGSHHAMAVYELTVKDDEFCVVTAATSLPFDHTHYSEFKYGRRDIAEQYGKALAQVLAVHFSGTDGPVVIIGTPYKRVPNAARMLAIAADRHLRALGLPTSYTYIYQHRLVVGDYCTLTAQERDERNRQKKRYVDPDDFAGKHVVVIDDVRITGSIERSIMGLLDGIPVLSTTVLNLVRLDSDVALHDPRLEDKLNHRAVRGLPDLVRLMDQRDQFMLTTRAVKFVLQADPSDVNWFLDRLDATQALDFYDAVVDEGYDIMPRYEQVFRLVHGRCSP